jgi:hypothetical protein
MRFLQIFSGVTPTDRRDTLFMFVVGISPMPTLTLLSISVIGVFLSRMRVRNYSLKVRPSGQG